MHSPQGVAHFVYFGWAAGSFRSAPIEFCGASRRFLLTTPNTSCAVGMPAPLRSDGVRDHSGTQFGIIPELTFGFAGIPPSMAGTVIIRSRCLRQVQGLSRY